MADRWRSLEIGGVYSSSIKSSESLSSDNLVLRMECVHYLFWIV